MSKEAVEGSVPGATAPSEVALFADGACCGNPGPGGWAFILRDVETGRERRLWGGEPHSTNNRMELVAVIRGLEALNRPTRVRLVTDSQYVAKGISEWLAGWKAHGWKRKEGRRYVPIKNCELWQELDGLLARHQVRCEWIRGHAGHAENEECDRLAVAAYEPFVSARREAERL